MRHAIYACLALLVLSIPIHAAEAPPDPVEAVWRAQRLMFQYRSHGHLYRCDILAYKIQRILEQFGARDQLIVRGLACHDFAGAAQLEVIMESPVVATAENIREITEYNSEDELIARVRGVPLPSAENIERFPAAWETVAIQRAPRIHLEASDCALVQQLRQQILPKMSVQIVKDITRVDCTQANPRLTVMALVARL